MFSSRKSAARPLWSRSEVLMQGLEDRTLLSVPHFDHVVVVMEENKSPMQVIGNSGAPYINSLMQGGAYLSESFATSRPSQPNYIALFSGSPQGVKTNDTVNLGNIANLGSQLIGAGKSIVGYSEGLPSVGYTGATSGRYARKHNPFADFSNIPATSNRPYTDFPTDYTKLPMVSFVIPNLDDDSHDGTLAEADTWLKNNMSAYAAWAKTHNSLLIITYDEGDLADASNHIPTIFYGANVRAGNYGNEINHYNVLRTIEDIYGLSPLANAANAVPIDYIWNDSPPQTIAAPGNLIADPISATQINLSWSDKANNETGYKIERSTDGVNFSILGGTGIDGHGFSNTGLASGKKYYYRVYATSAIGNSGFSNIASATTVNNVTPPPAAPASLAATAVSSSEIKLTWVDKASNELGYRIERSLDDVTFSFVANTAANATFYNNMGLSAATKYYYRVQAIGASSNSAFSNLASATTQPGNNPPPPPGVPAAPTNLSARGSTSVANAIDLSWTDNANNETGYKIERSTDGKTFSPLAGGGANTIFNRNTNLTPGRVYYYRVYAVNAAGNSAFSNVVSSTTSSGGTPTPPAAPSGLTAAASSSSAIHLAWADNAGDETGYRIERSSDGVNFGLLAGVGANVKSYDNTGLAASTKYYYRVQALGNGANSGYSNIANATTQTGTTPPPGVPAAPTNLTLKKSSSVANAIDLSWLDNASNETGYKIERSTDGKNFYALAGGGANSTFYRNTGLTPGRLYYYRVYAVNAKGSSSYSNVASLVL